LGFMPAPGRGLRRDPLTKLPQREWCRCPAPFLPALRLHGRSPLMSSRGACTTGGLWGLRAGPALGPGGTDPRGSDPTGVPRRGHSFRLSRCEEDTGGSIAQSSLSRCRALLPAPGPAGVRGPLSMRGGRVPAWSTARRWGPVAHPFPGTPSDSPLGLLNGGDPLRHGACPRCSPEPQRGGECAPFRPFGGPGGVLCGSLFSWRGAWGGGVCVAGRVRSGGDALFSVRAPALPTACS